MENNKYKTSKIFEIINKKGRFIGSTFSLALSNKLASYRKDFLNYTKGLKKYNIVFEILKHGCYKINLLESFSCSSIDELRAREQFWIEKLNCINKDYENFEKVENNMCETDENKISHEMVVKVKNDTEFNICETDEPVSQDAKIENVVSRDDVIENVVSRDVAIKTFSHIKNDENDKSNNFEKIKMNAEPFKLKIMEDFAKEKYDKRQKTKNKKKDINSTRKMPFVFDKIKQLDKDIIEKKVTKEIKDFKFELSDESEESEENDENEEDEEDFEFIDGNYDPIIDKYNTSETMSFIELCKINLSKKGRTDIIDKCFEKYNSFVKTDITTKVYAKDLIREILQL